MALEWIVFFKELPKLIKDLGGLANNSRATKNLLLSELKKQLKTISKRKKMSKKIFHRLIEIRFVEYIYKSK